MPLVISGQLARSAAVPRGSAASVLPLVARTVLVAVIVAALVCSASLAVPSSGAAAADHDLARLLRAMAAIKALMVAGAVAATWWRLAVPIGPTRFAATIAAAAAMAFGLGLIWGLHHIALGATLLHAGLVASVVLLWRDPATAARLRDYLRLRSTRHAVRSR